MISIDRKRAVRHILVHRELKVMDFRIEVFRNDGMISDLPDVVVLLFLQDDNDYLVFPGVDSAIQFLTLNYDL